MEFLFRGLIATKSLIKVTVCEQIKVKPVPLYNEGWRCRLVCLNLQVLSSVNPPVKCQGSGAREGAQLERE